MEANVLLVSVISARGLYLKGHSTMEALVTVTMHGKSNLRSRAVTEPIHTEGECHWDEHMEFKINDPTAELVVCAQHKSRIGRNDVIGRVEMPLDKAKAIRGDHWYPLRKKASEEKYRGEVQLRFEFRLEKSNLSISNQSLNTIGHKDSMLDKIKGKIKLGKLRHKNDPDSLSIASGISGVSAISAVSKVSKGGTISRLFGKKKQKYEEDGISGSHSIEEPANGHSPASHRSNLLEPLGHSNPPAAFQRMGSQRWRQNSFKQLSTDMQEKDPDETLRENNKAEGAEISTLSTAESFQSPPHPARPPSVASSGISSNHRNQTVSDEMHDAAHRQDLLAKIDKLEMEVRVKDSRLRDMEEYLDDLLSRVMERCPEVLASATGNGALKGMKNNRRFFSTIGF
ncbi:unnamed protein product, partial [Mesorhabditis belari]|uniref:FIP-RBD domain-containing protein n=1 Tax=Mesorhabditis belari TaxID=2138241 RepID=A0AAF3EIH1_9BILA